MCTDNEDTFDFAKNVLIKYIEIGWHFFNENYLINVSIEVLGNIKHVYVYNQIILSILTLSISLCGN